LKLGVGLAPQLVGFPGQFEQLTPTEIGVILLPLGGISSRSDIARIGRIDIIQVHDLTASNLVSFFGSVGVGGGAAAS
jgi:hypothetical protein